MTATTVLAVLAALIVAGAFGLALWSAMEVRRLQRRQMIQESALMSLKGALSAVCSDELAVDQRQAELERRMRQLAEQQEQLLSRDAEQGPYRHAVRLAAKGASREEIMKSCGVSRGEADLLRSLHGPQNGTPD
ncbi:MAG: DUF2802 domain-containing protein [Thioalkalivibrio sp.]|nr:MAG: DUF2802 domain-containing protein [Thioalkalivibrio sp.]